MVLMVRRLLNVSLHTVFGVARVAQVQFVGDDRTCQRWNKVLCQPWSSFYENIELLDQYN